MHIVIIAWLFVIGLMALALSSTLAGIVWFIGAGVLPVLLVGALVARRVSARRRNGNPR